MVYKNYNNRLPRIYLDSDRITFVLGTAGFLLSCLPSLFDFGTQFPLLLKSLQKEFEICF
jgi:hypothetical protein